MIAKGEGCYLWDTDGRRYFDGIGGMWCVNVGYGRSEIAQTMASQALELCYSTTFVDVTNAPAARLATRLAELAPGDLNHVAYATCGSTAVDTAIRLAHYFHSRNGQPSRRYVISRKNSYHGSSYLGMTVGMRDGDQSPHFKYVPDLVHHLSAPYPYRRPEGMSLEQFGDFLVASLKRRFLNSVPKRLLASLPSRRKRQVASACHRQIICLACGNSAQDMASCSSRTRSSQLLAGSGGCLRL